MEWMGSDGMGMMKRREWAMKMDEMQGALDVGLEAVLVRTGKYITG